MLSMDFSGHKVQSTSPLGGILKYRSRALEFHAQYNTSILEK
jgi:hypothetical protein